jgi:L-lysine exporter family protein LysE/ArgO
MGIGGGLIIAIGAQNAFILAQGVRRNHPLQTACVCFFCDAALIIIGVSGCGALIASNNIIQFCATWLGVAFLTIYGARALLSAIKGASFDNIEGQILSRRKLLLTTLALTFFNPHVYIDTVLLVGSIGSQFPMQGRILFASGAITASLIWFFSLSLGAGFLAPLFKNKHAWRCLDSLVCLMMWSVALSLVV